MARDSEEEDEESEDEGAASDADAEAEVEGDDFDEDEADEDEDEDEDEDSHDSDSDDDDDDDDEHHHAWKAPLKVRRPFPFCCLKVRVQPEDDTLSGSDDDSTVEPLPPTADIRVTLRVIAASETQFKDLLSGSNPYLLIKPDGAMGRRPMLRTSTTWRTSNIDLGETFTFDMRHDELPMRLVLWDELNLPNGAELSELQEARGRARNGGGGGAADLRESFLGYVLVPDADDDESGGGGGRRGKRARAVPGFTFLPEAEPEDAPTSFFPVIAPRDHRLGEDAFGDATRKGSGGAGDPQAGITLAASFQRLDPETGELLDAVEDVLDETEIDRRALLRFMHATSDPPRRVWLPAGNWRSPDASEDVTQWSGVKTELFERVRRADEKTGKLFLPLRVPRVVHLDVSKSQAQGSFPKFEPPSAGRRKGLPEWFCLVPSLGRSLVHLRTIYLHDNKIEGPSEELPDFAALKQLTVLDLSNNTLRGRVDNLKLPQAIKVLNLDCNYMKGPINPSWFWGIPNCEILRLSGNKLKCAVPKRCWHYMPRLEALYLAQAMLSGGIPRSLADATALQVIDLSENGDLDGEVPASLLELRRLEELRLLACHRLSDSGGVVAELEARDVAVARWSTGVPPSRERE